MNKSEYKKYTSRFSSYRVGVCGDMILDRYIYGNATRISQEAPVPVVLWKSERKVLGGAANVANNIVTLSAHAVPFGIIGADEEGKTILSLMETAGMSMNGMVKSSQRLTTVKIRLLAGNQQVVRLDHEVVEPLSQTDRPDAEKRLETAIKNHAIDALIFEDYAKGYFDCDFIQYANRLGKENGLVTTLDPHPSNAFNIKGLTLMTPNRKEAFQLAGMPLAPSGDNPLEDEKLLETGRRLMELWEPELLLITLGAKGMILFRKDKTPFHIPTLARQVFDVSGAGDTVMATMTLALLAGAEPEIAASIANHAAGVVVGKVGTAPIFRDELDTAFEE